MTDIAPDEKACAQTSLADHIARFWHMIENEPHVRILVNVRRDTSSVPYWDSSSFPNDVAKAIAAERRASPSQVAPQPQAGEAVAWLIRSNSGGNTWAQLTPDIAEADRDYVEITPLYASPQPANPAQVTDAARELWDDATNAVCQTMQERGMCNCSDGDCVAAKVEPAKEDIAQFLAAISAGGQAVATAVATIDALEHGKNLLLLADAIERRRFSSIITTVAAKQLRDADEYLSALSQPHPADERVVEALEPFAALGEWEHLPGTDMPDEFEPFLTRHYKTVPITIGHLRAARALRSRLRAGVQEGWGSQAADDVLAERRRQIDAEGWTPEHDNVHSDGQMAAAAACYAKTASMPSIDRAAAHFGTPIGWPWGREWWKPKDRRCDLVRAAALLIAEIERLDRRPAAPSEQGGDRG